MGRLRITTKALARQNLEPDDRLTEFDACALEAGIEFATCLYISYDPGTGGARIANAGHPPPLVREPKRRVPCRRPSSPPGPVLVLPGALVDGGVAHHGARHRRPHLAGPGVGEGDRSVVVRLRGQALGPDRQRVGVVAGARPFGDLDELLESGTGRLDDHVRPGHRARVAGRGAVQEHHRRAFVAEVGASTIPDLTWPRRPAPPHPAGVSPPLLGPPDPPPNRKWILIDRPDPTGDALLRARDVASIIAP
ncbi:SpoIIE family protein phosphatase [Streptomyces sp. NPDC007355]|uniref:SpoIIE family protein phosphatase n=1 Tax=Streptomyces sp. NPDC007355 TaxID=3364778 RepID=UPI0036BC468C